MACNSISIKPYIKSHLELQREITLIELAPSPYFFVQSICLAYMNMFARFDDNPAMTLQDIKKTKRYRRTDARKHGQCENSIPTTNKVCGGYNYQFVPSKAVVGVDRPMKAPSMHKSPIREKMSKFSLLSFCQNYYF